MEIKLSYHPLVKKVYKMEKELTKEEKAILEHIFLENIKLYPNLIEHIENVTVLSREKTGIGLYLNFDYKCNAIQSLCDNENLVLTSKDFMHIEGLRSPLTYEVNFTNGYLDFLEIVSNDGEWNGVIENLQFEKDDWYRIII